MSDFVITGQTVVERNWNVLELEFTRPLLLTFTSAARYSRYTISFSLAHPAVTLSAPRLPNATQGGYIWWSHLRGSQMHDCRQMSVVLLSFAWLPATWRVDNAESKARSSDRASSWCHHGRVCRKCEESPRTRRPHSANSGSVHLYSVASETSMGHLAGGGL
jgi:hypothetical protein